MRLLLFAALVVVGVGAAAQAAEGETFTVGAVTLPFVEDAAVVSCESATPTGPVVWTNVCIETPYDRADDIMNGYAGLLIQAGWTFAGGAGPQYWIERNPADGKCELLYLTAIGPYGLDDEEARTAKGRILFSHAASGPCMAEGSRR